MNLLFISLGTFKLLERVKMQLASFLEDPQYQDQHSLHTEIIKTFGRVGPNAEPRFRDECKLHCWKDEFFLVLRLIVCCCVDTVFTK